MVDHMPHVCLGAIKKRAQAINVDITYFVTEISHNVQQDILGGLGIFLIMSDLREKHCVEQTSEWLVECQHDKCKAAWATTLTKAQGILSMEKHWTCEVNRSLVSNNQGS